MRPFAPSQIRVLPLGCRCALLMKWLKNVQIGRPLFSAVYSDTMDISSGLISRTREFGRAKARCGLEFGGIPPLSNTSTLPVPGTPAGSMWTLCCPMVRSAFQTIFLEFAIHNDDRVEVTVADHHVAGLETRVRMAGGRRNRARRVDVCPVPTALSPLARGNRRPRFGG